MRTGRYLLLSVLLLPAGRLHAEPLAPHLTAEQAAQVLERVGRPVYPDEARGKWIQGSGLFQLKFDYETGKLREIHCLKSIGNGALDVAAIRGFKVWKAKPRTLTCLITPITFSLHH